MNKVKQLRLKKRVTQEEVANLLGISCPNYGKKENEKIRFSLEEAKTLSNFFGLSIEKLFFEDELSNFESSSLPKRVRLSKNKRKEHDNAQ